MKTSLATYVFSTTLLFTSVGAFSPGLHIAFCPPARLASTQVRSTRADFSVKDDTIQDVDTIKAPLKYIGPYPCLALRFPDLATPSQKKLNKKGISLDFVVDTAANTNTINGQVAKELGLEVVGNAPGGLGSQGAIMGGDLFSLGNAQLEGVPPIASRRRRRERMCCS